MWSESRADVDGIAAGQVADVLTVLPVFALFAQQNFSATAYLESQWRIHQQVCAHTSVRVRKHARTQTECKCAPAHTCMHAHACTHAHARTHTRTHAHMLY